MTGAADMDKKPVQDLIAPIAVVLGWVATFVWSLITVYSLMALGLGRALMGGS